MTEKRPFLAAWRVILYSAKYLMTFRAMYRLEVEHYAATRGTFMRRA